MGLVRQLGLNLQFVLNTHVHADHITGTGDSMKETIPYCPPIHKLQYDMKSTGRLKRLMPNTKSVISKASGAKADILVSEGDIVRFQQENGGNDGEYD